RGDVVPAAVLEVDQGLVVPVDGDDAADDPGEPLQLRPVGVDLDVLVGPLAPQRLVACLRRVHAALSKGTRWASKTRPTLRQNTPRDRNGPPAQRTAWSRGGGSKLRRATSPSPSPAPGGGPPRGSCHSTDSAPS